MLATPTAVPIAAAVVPAFALVAAPIPTPADSYRLCRWGAAPALAAAQKALNIWYGNDWRRHGRRHRRRPRHGRRRARGARGG